MNTIALSGYTCLLLLGISILGFATPLGADFKKGVYGSRDDTIVVLNEKTWLPKPHLHYLILDGRYGTTKQDNIPFENNDDSLLISNSSGISTTLEWREIVRTSTTFLSHGYQLAGELIETTSDLNRKRPLLVMVHGSEKEAAIGNSRSLLLAAQGISVFVYDKRGTGQSEGEYTQNFELLADDAAAAMEHAQQLASGRFSRCGYFGASQGGWVAPLAATRSKVDFVAIGFGLVASPIEEDRDQMLSEIRDSGYRPSTESNIQRVSSATTRIVQSHFEYGFEELESLREELSQEPWFKTIQGEYSGSMLRMSDDDLRRVGRSLFDNLELQWDYNARAVLNKLDLPILWVVAQNDRAAPSEQTIKALSDLKAKGKPIQAFLFPDTDHGMYDFIRNPDGSRRYTKVTEGYFRLLGDFILGQVNGSYGRGKRIE